MPQSCISSLGPQSNSDCSAPCPAQGDRPSSLGSFFSSFPTQVVRNQNHENQARGGTQGAHPLLRLLVKTVFLRRSTAPSSPRPWEPAYRSGILTAQLTSPQQNQSVQQNLVLWVFPTVATVVQTHWRPWCNSSECIFSFTLVGLLQGQVRPGTWLPLGAGQCSRVLLQQYAIFIPGS